LNKKLNVLTKMSKIKYNNNLKEVARIIGQNVSRIRGGMTKTELSQTAGLSRTTLADIEKGERRPNLITLIKLANALGVDLFELFKPISMISDGEKKINDLINNIHNEDLFLIKIIDGLIEKRIKSKILGGKT